MTRSRRGWVGELRVVVNAPVGHGSSLGDDVGIGQHPEQPQTGSAAGLAGTQHVTFPALFEVDIGKRKPVANVFKALARG